MVSQRGGGGNVGIECGLPFDFNTIATFFDVVPLEVHKEILIVEFQDSKVEGDCLKRFSGLGKFWKK